MTTAISESPLRFGIAGAGMVARYHATAIAQTPGARLVAMCRSQSGDAADVAARFGVPCEPDYAALLARHDIDAVCICTPSGLHAAQTIAAAEAGKHVLVEKPIALTLADADAMIAACERHGVRLGVALQRRADPLFQALRAAIAGGALGRITLATVSIPYLREQSYYASAAWRGSWALDGGGVLMNQGIHLLDLLLWLIGDDVAEVRAHAATLARAIAVEDCVAASLRFEGGALGAVAATTTAAPGFPHRIAIYGERGGAQIAGEQLVRWDAAGAEHMRAYLAAPATPADAGAGANPAGIGAVGHTRLLGDFVAAIRDGRAPLVGGAEARRSLALVLAIYAAAGIGGAQRRDVLQNDLVTIIQDLEQQLRTATMLNTIDLHDQLLADTWVNTNANGTTTTKPQLLALLQSHPFTFLSIDDEDVVIRCSNEVAIVTGRSTRRRANPDASIISQVVRFTRVYTYLEHRWQVVAAQATPIPE